ncbi:MAG: hypothetical protein JW834_04720 [Candidatus Diapherotrites archaeon]|nr:hypothetical protein [Candidatus Diapherotrites archaeon]
MHRLLERQLKKYLSAYPNVPEDLKQFIKAIDEAYKQADKDRAMVERSLELISDEFMALNRKLKADIERGKHAEEQLKEKLSEVEKLNKFLLGREMRIVDLKEKLEDLESRNRHR